MKGSRAKRLAEEANAAATAEIAPSPPTVPREGGPRPGPIVQGSGEMVQIPDEVFKRLCNQLRTNEILGAAAADAFEAAAGMRPVASPQSKGAKELRTNVANAREEDEKPKKKKGMNFSDAPIEEIPDLPEAPPKQRPSFRDADMADHDLESMTNHPQKDAAEPPELNLTPKQNNLRTNLEMWVMDAIPALYGVDDSEELDESLQEDGQADKITFLIAEKVEEAQRNMVSDWLKDAPEEGKPAFIGELLNQVQAIQALNPKKKKKKAAAAE